MAGEPFRIGFGYDLHQLVAGSSLLLGGVPIPSELTALGHSDADVLLHAITDALLGALALGDIGYYFPDTDPQYKGANSQELLRKTYELVKAKGYRLGNLDATVILEKPKLQPHISQIRTQTAEVLELNLDQVSIKATTNEKKDAIGEGQALAVHAVVLLFKVAS